jgi:hypothetical protein
MTAAMYDHTVPPLLRSLGALSAVLAKAEAHCAARKIEPSALLAFRLYPDMLPLTRQVQLACDFAARAVARLTGADLPAFPDTETSFAELAARIAAATAYIEGYAPARFDAAATREVVLKLRGTERHMTGLDYLTQFCLPNVYFHCATAYNILRHNGVELGKSDFIGA